MRIDAHQHFWKFDPIRDAWIDDTMKTIQRDFLPDDLRPLFEENNISGCVAVQADQSDEETDFLLGLAHKNAMIKGVVGWVDLTARNLDEHLTELTKDPLLKGVRHIAQSEVDDYFLRKDVQNGIGRLRRHGLTFDILIYPRQLSPAIELVRKFPDQKFVLDHMAKPRISEQITKHWSDNIQKIASYPNVSCKLSGMVTETTNYNWTKEQFHPFLDLVVSAFGTKRLMYGSDWPVCLLAAMYQNQLAIVEEYISAFSNHERNQIMGENAIAFYNLKTEKH